MTFLKKSAPEKKYIYKPLTTEFMETRKNQRGGDSDGFVSPTVKMFSMSEGDNVVRILPAFGIDSSYGYEIFAHYQIGSDNSSYLCLKAMKEEPCPICEEKERAMKSGDDEYAKAMRNTKRVVVWCIDRAKEGDGPKLWSMPYTLEREMAAQAMDKKTGKVIQFIDPNDGFDLNFTKQGKVFPNIKYIGVGFDREPSPLSDDTEAMQAWLAFVEANPIPDQLVYQNYEYITKQFSGVARDNDSGTDKAPAKKGKFGSKKTNLEVSLTWEEVQETDETSIEKLAKKYGIEDLDEQASSLEEAQLYICDRLGIERPKTDGKTKPKLNLGKKEEPTEELAEEATEPAGELPTWDEVHALEGDDLFNFGTEHGVDMEQQFDDLADAQDKVCEALGIEKTEEKKKPSLKLGGKLSKLKSKAK